MEAQHSDTQTLKDQIASLSVNCALSLNSLGYDVGNESLAQTPKRWAKMMMELTTAQDFEMTTFPAEGYDQMIIERQIPFYTLCEHHLIPFFGTAAVAYVPDERIVGISKLSRSVEFFARRLQVQERMSQQIAEHLWASLQPKGVAVLLRARHLCQEMRGVKKMGAETVTSKLLGVFRDDNKCRQEFLSLA